MSETDVETLLRMRGERGLSDYGFDLLPDARTLVAVGALSEPRARAVVDDYERVRALRGGETQPLVMQQPAPGSPPDLRIVGCPTVIERDDAVVELRYLVLTSGRTALRARLRRAAHAVSAPSAPGRRQWGQPHYRDDWPPPLEITDDRGTTMLCGFSGGGSDTEMDGTYEARPGLAADTRWIAVAGHRVELVDQPAPVVTVARSEARSTPHLVAEHLEYLLSLRGQWSDSPALRALDVLIECGLLGTDDPLARRTRRIAAALDDGTPEHLPEPWSSIVRRRDDGPAPVRSVAIGAVSPVIEGCSVAVLHLDSGPDEFSLDVELSGPVALRWDEAPLGVPTIAATAADDRGNHYLGSSDSFGWGPDGTEAEFSYWPALDPAATHLDLVFSTGRNRATVPVPLTDAR